MAQGDNKTTQKGTNAMFVMMHNKIAHARAAQIFSLTATLSLIIVHKKNSHCWVRRRYCLAGITKLGERVAKNTKLG